MYSLVVVLRRIKGGVWVKNNLRLLMAQKHINITQLSGATGVSRNTIASIYHEKTTRMDIKTITVICNYFECTPNDLIVIPKEVV